MARKKVLFIIVEGPSDDEALGLIFTRLFSANHVHVEITHGDITSRNDINKDNIVSKIGDIVRKYAANYSLKQSDFLEVIHIIDTDGTYISDDNIVEDISLNGIKYSLSEIRCPNKSAIEHRNEKKRENLDRIIYQPHVWKSVPYKAYYMSSNLDHVLYDKQNNDDEGKKSDSLVFSRKYRNDINGFVEFMTNSDFSVVNGYKESWEFIKQDNHSIERHSNLGLALNYE
jgi:hypothetical protein